MNQYLSLVFNRDTDRDNSISNDQSQKLNDNLVGRSVVLRKKTIAVRRKIGELEGTEADYVNTHPDTVKSTTVILTDSHNNNSEPDSNTKSTLIVIVRRPGKGGRVADGDSLARNILDIL